MKLLWEEQAWEDYCWWQTKDTEADQCPDPGYSAEQLCRLTGGGRCAIIRVF